MNSSNIYDRRLFKEEFKKIQNGNKSKFLLNDNDYGNNETNESSTIHIYGDNFVDFGMYDMSRPVVRDFVNGYERSILLDFNVDGNIWDLM